MFASLMRYAFFLLCRLFCNFFRLDFLAAELEKKLVLNGQSTGGPKMPNGPACEFNFKTKTNEK